MPNSVLVSVARKGGLRALFLLFLLFALSGSFLAPTPVLAQEEGYEEWLEQQQQEYEEYLSEQDKAFLEFLDKEWKDVDVGPRSTSPIDNKPREVPRVDDAGVSSDGLPQTNPSEPQQPQDAERPSESDDSFEEESSFEDEAVEERDDFFEEQDDSFGQANAPSNRDRDPFSDEAMQNVSSESSENTTPAAQPTGESTSTEAEVDLETNFSFFGVSTTIPYGEAIVPQLQGKPDQSSIQQYWRSMAEAPYRPTLNVLQEQRSEMALSDWGYYLYLRELGTQLYGTTTGRHASRDATLWTWFMMMKSGYGVRVGYQEDEVFLMLPVDEQIFDRPQMHIEGQRYYLMVSEVGGSLRTYEGEHPEADRVLRLDEDRVPIVSEASQKRSVEFSFQGERYEMEIAHNPAVIEYLDAYPNVELKVLFRAGVSSVARQSLVDALGPLVEGQSPREAVNLLLKFAQFSTQYKRDRDHFGEERFLFPEETLAFEHSDCEDRAVLLAYLVRTLLDREVVGLKWPRHVALAVKAGDGFDVEDTDRHVTVNGEPYIFADPTYIGSTVGMEMPIVEDSEPEIMDL